MNVPPGELRTARLVLAPLAVDDAAAMVGVLADPELYTFTGGAPPSLVELTQLYESQVAGSGSDDEVWHNWIMRLVDHDVAIGFVQATITGDEADVAWVVGTEWQGAGYAKEAVAAMTGWLVDNGVTRLCAHIHPNHLASQGVAISAGLARTGQIDDDGEEIWAAGSDPLI